MNLFPWQGHTKVRSPKASNLFLRTLSDPSPSTQPTAAAAPKIPQPPKPAVVVPAPKAPAAPAAAAPTWQCVSIPTSPPKKSSRLLCCFASQNQPLGLLRLPPASSPRSTCPCRSPRRLQTSCRSSRRTDDDSSPPLSSSLGLGSVSGSHKVDRPTAVLTHERIISHPLLSLLSDLTLHD